MPTNTTSATEGASYIGSYENIVKQRKPTNEMGKDQFLQMLVTQMKSQDPMSPMQDNQFMAQMTQFSMLEQMQNMSLSFSQAHTSTLIGKGIYATVEIPDNAGNVVVREIAGIVDSAGTDKGKPYVMVSGQKIPIERVTQVYDSAILTGDPSQILGGAAVIGKYVTAEIPLADGTKQPVSGIIESFYMKDGMVTFKLGDKEFMLTQITSMSANPPAPKASANTALQQGENVQQDTDTNTEPSADKVPEAMTNGENSEV